MDPWKRRFLLETIISRFHVNFWGCIFSMVGIRPWKSTIPVCLQDLTSQDGRMLSAAHLAADAGHVQVKKGKKKTLDHGSWDL